MTQLKTTKQQQQYKLRMLERYVVYDPDRGVHIFRDWAAGAIVTDQNEIAFLESRDAPVERVPLDLKN